VTTGAVVVRAMTQADLEPVGRLAEGLVRLHHAWDAARFFLTDDIAQGYRWYFGTLLNDEKAVLRVVTVDGEVAGYLFGALEPRDWNLLLDAHGAIHDLFVDPRFRRQGLAQRLLREGLAALEAKGAPRVVLSTSTANAEGRALFERLGFRATMVEMTREKGEKGE
jgi:ribosomal protein S18 acetylase RimI-like enzyme